MTDNELSFQCLNRTSSRLNSQHYTTALVSVCKMVSAQPFWGHIETYRGEFIQSVYVSEPPLIQCDSCFLMTADFSVFPNHTTETASICKKKTFCSLNPFWSSEPSDCNKSGYCGSVKHFFSFLFRWTIPSRLKRHFGLFLDVLVCGLATG